MMLDFTTNLLSHSPAFARDLERCKPKSASVRIRMELLEEVKGGERQARETLISFYGLHGLHQPNVHLLKAAGYAELIGKLKDRDVQSFLFAHRTQLARLMRPTVKKLHDLNISFDYDLLYQDLLYHTLHTSRRWQSQYEDARSPGLSVESLTESLPADPSVLQAPFTAPHAELF